MAKKVSLPKGRKRGYTTTKRKAHGSRSHWSYWKTSSSSTSSSSASSESSESI